MEHQYMIVDFFGAGTVLGEMATLLNMTRNASVECETDVQVSTIATKTNSVTIFFIMLCRHSISLETNSTRALLVILNWRRDCGEFVE